MHVFRRLSRYLRPQWRQILLGLVMTGLFALFSGFSIGLILPIIDKVFMRAPDRAAPPPALSVAEGLAETRDAVAAAWAAGGTLRERGDAMRAAAGDGLTRIQDASPPLEILAWLCAVTLVAILLKNAADYGRKVAFIKVEQGAAEMLRTDLFRHVAGLPLSTHRRYASGQILSRLITDVELVKQFTINTGATFLHSAVQALVFLAIILWASFKLSLVSFLIVPPIVFLTGRLASRLRRHSSRAQARIAQVTSILAEMLGNIRVVKAFGAEAIEGERFAHETGRYRRSMIRLMGLDSLAAPLSEFWGVAIGVGVLYAGGTLVLATPPEMSAGRFFVFFLALISMLHPLKVVATVYTRFQRGAAAADRLFEILDLPPERDAPHARPVTGVEREIRFENVSFAYEPGRPVLRGITFAAGVGTTTALVGPSGGGKSTLVDLIPRFHDAVEGRVLLDDADVRDLRRADLRRLIGIVTQETILFDDTVHNNIAYGSPGATRDGVMAAARSANAHTFIQDLPRGYDTVIGERGLLLSGGQRQRLAIARALLRNPPILILDEATSSLDTESEVAVQEALDRLLVHRTTFVIAHRLSTVMGADRILVLDQGRIVEDGTHRALLAGSTLYRRLYDLQFRDEAAV